jgi:hypothetical protein
VACGKTRTGRKIRATITARFRSTANPAAPQDLPLRERFEESIRRCAGELCKPREYWGRRKFWEMIARRL